MDGALRQFIGVLAVAMIVAIAARRLKLPYTVGLVVVGLGLAATKHGVAVALTHDMIFDLILPPLLFEAAINLSWRELRRDLTPILVFAIFGTLMAAAVTAFGMGLLLDWPAPAAALFGVIIAATDPVAVIAMFKDNEVKGRLRLFVESESLFNDGVAAVLFVVGLAWSEHAAAGLSGTETLTTLLRVAFGGLAVGASCGGAAIVAAGRTEDHLVEAALTTVAAYGSFLLAEGFDMSGVLASVAAGLVMGNFGALVEEEKSFLSSRGRDFVLGSWEFVAFLANSAIFLLIGANVAETPFSLHGASLLPAAIAVTLLGRALTVYPLGFAFSRSRWALTLGEQHVLWWGGLRGALALALALSLPPALPRRDEIVVAAFGVVAFSIVVQGLTMPLLLRRLGLLSRN
jgi:CPA1 family monovalent cation:H+ antiporter